MVFRSWVTHIQRKPEASKGMTFEPLNHKEMQISGLLFEGLISHIYILDVLDQDPTICSMNAENCKKVESH